MFAAKAGVKITKVDVLVKDAEHQIVVEFNSQANTEIKINRALLIVDTVIGFKIIIEQ